MDAAEGADAIEPSEGPSLRRPKAAPKKEEKEASMAAQRYLLARSYTALVEGLRSLNYSYYAIAQSELHLRPVFDERMYPGDTVSLMSQTAADIASLLRLSEFYQYFVINVLFQVLSVLSFFHLFFSG